MSNGDMIPQGGPPVGRGAGPGHEHSEIKLRPLIVFVVALTTVTVAVLFLVAGLMGEFHKSAKEAAAERPPLFTDTHGQFPEPQSQVIPRVDLAKLREQERAALDSYGWADRKAGIARIPIDRAVEILAEKGLPKGRSTPPRGSRTRDQK